MSLQTLLIIATICKSIHLGGEPPFKEQIECHKRYISCVEKNMTGVTSDAQALTRCMKED